MLRQLAFKCKTGETEKYRWCRQNTHKSHKAYCAWSFYMCSNYTKFKIQWTSTFKKKKKNRLLFLNICDLESMSRSSNLVSTGRPTPAYNNVKVERPLRNSAKIRIFVESKNVNYLPWMGAKVINGTIFMIYLTYSATLHRFNLTGYEHSFF